MSILLFSCKKEKVTADMRPKDMDGNVYDTVVIGTQTWMTQNLKTTKYNDGTSITTDLDDAAWAIINVGAFTVYNANSTFNTTYYNDTYGKLYNWHAVNTGKLAPKGWHVPSDAEWTTLINYLGGTSIAGAALKDTSLLWQTPNLATNSSKFKALPGGFRNSVYDDIRLACYFWTSSLASPNTPMMLYLYANDALVHRATGNPNEGFSVRCIRD